MKKLHIYSFWTMFILIVPSFLSAQNISVPAQNSEFVISPERFLVDYRGGQHQFQLSCERWFGESSSNASGDPIPDEPIGDLPPLLELNIVGFEMIDFDDTGGQIDHIQCTYENWPLNTIFFKPNPKHVDIEGSVTIRHYTYYSNKPKAEKSLVITYRQDAKSFISPPSDTLADGGRITPVINLDTLEGNFVIDNVTAASGTVSNITYRWERKGNNNQWQTIPSATGLSVMLNVPSQTTYYRRIAIAGQQTLYSNVCVVYPRSLGDENYISKVVPRKVSEAMVNMYMEENTYYNGLGYPIQSVRKKNIGNCDLVTPIVYDAANRSDAKQYLPFTVSNNDGKYVRNPMYLQERFYFAAFSPAESTCAYVEKEYEQSAMNRVRSIRNAGAVFRDGDIRTNIAFAVNAANEVMRLETDTDGCLIVQSYYGQGKLSKNIVTNEDGLQTITYRDNRDSLVMQRTVGDTETLDTYYVYDDFGRLAWVVPPQASASLNVGNRFTPASSLAAKYCYIYSYDKRGRLAERKLPGKNSEYFVYDRGDRLTMSQNGVMRSSNKWNLTRYDELSRLVKQTEIVRNESREQLQALFDNNDTLDLYATEGRTLHSILYDSYPLVSSWEILTPPTIDPGLGGGAEIIGGNTGNIENEIITGEDPKPTYVYAPYHYFKAIDGVVDKTDIDTNVVAMKTMEKLALLAPNGTMTDSIVRYYFYDPKGRIVQLCEIEGSDCSRYSYLYDFNDNVLIEHQTHGAYSGATSADQLVRTYTYDRYNRPTSEITTLNDGTPAEVYYMYNDLGQLESKTFGNGTTETFSYNIQGWTTDKNSDNFDMRLSYFESEHSGVSPHYTGNIAECQWQHLNGSPQAYAYSYDAFGRLTGTEHFDDDVQVDRFIESNIDYDRNGNILTLDRYADGMQVDGLSYTYDGNRLVSLREEIPDCDGDVYAQGSFETESYFYDANGNMVYDSRRGLNLQYNFINLIRNVSDLSTGTVKAAYTYSADGVKRRVEDADRRGYRYRGDLVYRLENGISTLESASFAGGRIVRSGSDYLPKYFITDHLGSVRVVEDAYGAVEETNDYYPFGCRWADSGSAVSTNRYRFAGKEEQRTGELDFIDFGARMYDPALARWFVQDCYAEKYFPLSPYCYCANNPLNVVDPDGKIIAQSSEKEWDQFKAEIQGVYDKLMLKLDKGGNSKRLDALRERAMILQHSLEMMNNLQNDLSQRYVLNFRPDQTGGISHDLQTGDIIIHYNSSANFIHEMIHAGQFYTQDIAFAPNNANKIMYNDVYDEIAAYKAQYAFSPISVDNLVPDVKIHTESEITVPWLRAIRHPISGKEIYAENSDSGLGLISVNIHSSKQELEKAYPWNAAKWKFLPDAVSLKDILNLYYHK